MIFIAILHVVAHVIRTTNYQAETANWTGGKKKKKTKQNNQDKKKNILNRSPLTDEEGMFKLREKSHPTVFI
jgi:di/tripeptidase